jgi:hypothetical protein
VTIRLRRILFLGLCISLASLWAAWIRSAAHGALRAVDFGVIYYGARCALEHKDPYDPQTVLREFQADGGWFSGPTPRDEQADRIVLSRDIYLPTGILVVAPLAMLPWHVALAIWLSLIEGLLVLGSLLAVDLARGAQPLAGCIACFMVLNCPVLLISGNPTGIVVPFCVIAAWCFLKERYALAGVAILSVSLVLKPHDAGFVWLYFLLAGGTGRKRALQTLAIAAVLGICAAVWIWPLSPHWFEEVHNNVAAILAPGSVADPSPTGPSSRTACPILGLQNSISIVWNNPHFYNSVSYLVGGGLVLAWAVVVMRKRTTREGTLLALAAISVLTLLPMYHQQYDAKLLLLALPACAMLWAGKGAKRWIALVLTSAAVFVTSDFPLIFWSAATKNVSASASTMTGKLTLLLLEPGPLILLSAGCFYLWAYTCYEPPVPGAGRREEQTVTQLTAG